MKATSFLRKHALDGIALAGLIGVLAYAAAPVGGYLPGQTLDPDCAPGDANCFVQIAQPKFVAGSGGVNAVYTGGNA